MGRSKKGLKIDGWINFNKPIEMGSTDAVNIIRRTLNAQKAGHAGTLDPLATGVLPIALGEATKTIPHIQDTYKTYEFTVQWGAQTNTDDLEGEVVHISDKTPSEEDVKSLLHNYIGDVEQTPPQFSAIKIDGKRAYNMARSGETVDIPPRLVYIEELKILSHNIELRQTSFLMLCGKGTYVRAIARDLGQDLECYGHVIVLTRTQVGGFHIKDTISLDFLKEIEDNTATDSFLLPVETALDDIPALSVTQQEASQLRQGRALTFVSRSDSERLTVIGVNFATQEEVTALATFDGQALGLMTIKGVTVQPSRLFNL